jgi:uncharacterized protein YdhG (YjbR/CyaY superfamily)
MLELKTKVTDVSVATYLNTIEDPKLRQDCQVLTQMMQTATNAVPKMWGEQIIGFGTRTYSYPDGRKIDWMIIGFAPRKQKIALYLTNGFQGQTEMLAQLGKYSSAKSCLYIKRLSDIQKTMLEQLIQASVQHLQKIIT